MSKNRIDKLIGDRDSYDESKEILAKEMARVLGEIPEEGAVDEGMSAMNEIANKADISVRQVLGVIMAMSSKIGEVQTIGQKLGMQDGRTKILGGEIDVAKGEGLLVLTVKNVTKDGKKEKKVKIQGYISQENSLSAIESLKAVIKHLEEKIK